MFVHVTATTACSRDLSRIGPSRSRSGLRSLIYTKTDVVGVTGD